MRAALLAFALVAALGGCLTSTGRACATSPSAPVELTFSVDDACALYHGGSRATLRLFSHVDGGGVEGGLALPPGVTLVQGNYSFTGTLAKDLTIERSGVLRAATREERFLHAWMRGPTGFYGPDVPWGDDRDVGVSWPVDGEPSARLSGGPASPFAVRLAHEGANASHLLATVLSPIAVDARVHLYFSWPPLGFSPPGYDGNSNPPQSYRVDGHPEWTGERTWQGDIVRNAFLEWRGRLAPGQPLTLRFDAPVPPDGGPYTVGAYLLPDPAVDAGPHADEADFVVEHGVGRLVPRSGFPT